VSKPLLVTGNWKDTHIAKRPYKQGPYTKQEIAILKSRYPATSGVALAGTLNRSLVSVQRELREMGIGRREKAGWMPGQLKVLRKLFRDSPVWEIANRLGKSPSEIKRKAASLGLKKRSGRKSSGKR